MLAAKDDVGREGPERGPQSSGTFFGWRIVGGAFFIYFVSGGLFNTATVYFKALAEEFGWSRGELAGAFSLGFVVAGMSAPIWGRIADRLGPRSAFVPGALLTGVLCMLLSQISSLTSLYLLYVLFTFSAGGISLIPVSVVVSNWFVKKRGRAIGIAYTGVGFGVLILVPIVGLLVTTVGWRYAYVISGAIVVVALTPVALWMKSRPQDLGLLPDGFDPSAGPGTVTGEAHGHPAPVFALSMRSAVGSGTFWMVAMSWFAAMMPLMAVSLHQVPFLTDVGLSTESASLAAGTVGGASIIGRVGVGLLSERYQVQRIYAACYLLMGAGIVALWNTEALGWPGLVLYVAFFGISIGGSFALSPLLVGHLFGGRALGEIFGLLGLAATIGGAIGGTGAGLLYDLAGSYDWVFALCVMLCVIGSVIMLLVKRPPAAAIEDRRDLLYG